MLDIMEKQFRDLDVFARIGGDEFCAVLPMCPEDIVREKGEEGLEKNLSFKSFLAEKAPDDRHLAGFARGFVRIRILVQSIQRNDPCACTRH